MTPEQAHLHRLIDGMTCPECGEIGVATVIHYGQGLLGMAPKFQCDTPNCTYNHFGDQAWMLASSS